MDCGFLLALIFAPACAWLLLFRRYGSGPKQYTWRQWNADTGFRYQRKTVKLPTVRGAALRAVCRILNSLLGDVFFANIALKEGKFTMFRTIKMEEEPTFIPSVPFSGERAKPSDENGVQKFSDLKEVRCSVSGFDGISSYTDLYEDGSVTPNAVVKEVLSALEKSKRINAVIQYNSDEIQKMAQESTERYASKKQLSPVDGVPILIKDEFAVAGYPYSCGTSFLGEGVETKDCEVVRKLRSLGAVIIGVSNMHELGIGTTGNNPNRRFGAARNPYNTECYTGGSSSGCASAVAAGLCPVAIGTDGGGSIRIPSAYCGVVGLKPTFGRVSLAGLRKVTFSVGHAGPICTSVKDAALLYSMLAYPDPEYVHSLNQPKVELPDFSEGIQGLRVGIYRDYFEDCDDDVRQACDKAVKVLGAESGCKIVDIKIPELEEARIGHLIIILAEMTDAIQYEYDHHLDDLTPESQVLFRAGRKLSSTDFLQANKQRTRTMRFLKEAFEDVDVIVTPSTARTAPEIHPGDLSAGSFDAERDLKNMRYAYLGNLCGIPCISLPVGYSSKGMPIGLQSGVVRLKKMSFTNTRCKPEKLTVVVMAPWWKEDVLLQTAYHIESLLPQRKLPTVHYPVLKKL